MLQTIIEYTGFFLTVLFFIGILASILIAVWDQFQFSKLLNFNLLKKKKITKAL